MPEQALVLAPRTGALVRAQEGFGQAAAQFRLEGRKHRLMFGGYEIPAGSAVDGMLALWTFVGLPLAAAIYGATAGAGLRAPAAEEAEAPLPLPTSARLRGSLAGAVSGYLGLFALVMGAWLVRVQGPSSATPGTLAAAAPFSAALELAVLTASFVIGYASRHAVLAGLAGLSLGLVAYVPAGAAILIDWTFGSRADLGLGGWAVVAALGLGSPGAALAAGRLILPRLARSAKVSAAAWTTAALLLLAPLTPASLLFSSSLARLNGTRNEVGGRWGSAPRAEKAAFAAVPGRVDGRFYATFEGGLLFRPDDGPEVVLVPGNPLSPLTLWRKAVHPRFTNAGWGWDGRLWAQRSLIRDERMVREVYTAPKLGPLRLVGVCPDSCATDGYLEQVVVSNKGVFPPLLFSYHYPLVMPYTGPRKDRDVLDSAYGATLQLPAPEIKP
ncbi:MAG: hypothetical protein FD126_844 [Elusimicrobia bacterium]|nr:MAG: hypothetical protein FD126_844 [Elusimicrobiota bacterium]